MGSIFILIFHTPRPDTLPLTHLLGLRAQCTGRVSELNWSVVGGLSNGLQQFLPGLFVHASPPLSNLGGLLT